MIFWHLGAGLVLTRWLFGRQHDFRAVSLGLLLPDLVDKPIGRVFFRSRFESGRLLAHSVAGLGALLMALGVTRVRAPRFALSDKSSRRRQLSAGLSGLCAGIYVHLLLDRIWSDAEVALWPMLGHFPKKAHRGRWWRMLLPGLEDRKLYEELAGIVLLAYVFRSSGLAAAERRKSVIRSGELFTR